MDKYNRFTILYLNVRQSEIINNGIYILAMVTLTLT